MVTLAQLQRKADYWAAKLSVGPVRVLWLQDCPRANSGSKVRRTGELGRIHAHCHKVGGTQGTICVAAHVNRYQGAGTTKEIHRLMRHEVAHLVGKGKHGTKEFMATAGEKPKKRSYLIAERAAWAHNGQLLRTGGIYDEMGKAGIREVVEIRRQE